MRMRKALVHSNVRYRLHSNTEDNGAIVAYGGRIKALQGPSRGSNHCSASGLLWRHTFKAYTARPRVAWGARTCGGAHMNIMLLSDPTLRSLKENYSTFLSNAERCIFWTLPEFARLFWWQRCAILVEYWRAETRIIGKAFPNAVLSTTILYRPAHGSN